MEDKRIKQWYKIAWIVGLLVLLVYCFLLVNYYFSLGKSKQVARLPYGQTIDLSNQSMLVVDSNQTLLDSAGLLANDEAILSESQEYEIDDQMPWYSFSPNVAKETDYSLMNDYRVVYQEPLNDYSWRQTPKGLLLYQFNQPYTGWHDDLINGWRYYQAGSEIKELFLNESQVNQWQNESQIYLGLFPRPNRSFFFLRGPLTNQVTFHNQAVEYSILYRNPNQVIYAYPPGTYFSKAIGSTKHFVDVPMEVMRELTNESGTWLQVYTGYDQLGWVRKDASYEDYVLTYYNEKELLNQIEAVMAEYMSYVSATVGASFVNNESLSQVTLNNQAFRPASTQKIYVLGELYHQYQTGELSPSDYHTLIADDVVPGAGILAANPVGSSFSLDYLVDLVVSISDNTAANSLITAVGGGQRMTPHMHELGLYNTYVNGKYYHSDTNGRFQTSPGDAARYFALLYNNKLNGDPWDNELINKFFYNQHTYMTQLIPGSTTVWNKSGSGVTEQNDVASFVTPYGSFSLAVYTENPWNYDAVPIQMASLCLAVHNTFVDYRLKLYQHVDDPSAFMQDMIAAHPIMRQAGQQSFIDCYLIEKDQDQDQMETDMAAVE